MHYVYLLKNERTQSIYIGVSSNLRRRLTEHQKSAPWKLVYYEAFLDLQDARDRERKLKNYGAGLGHLKNRLRKSLQV